MASNLSQIFEDAGREWDIHPDILRAVSGQETGGTKDPNRAVSPKNAQGMMQIIPPTQAALGVTNPADPAQSIFGGAKYISQMRDRYNGDMGLALAAYNAGPGRVDKYVASQGRNPLPLETQNYVPGVAQKLAAIQSARQPATQAAPAEYLPSREAPVMPGVQSAASAASDDNPFRSAKSASAPAPQPDATPSAARADNDNPFTLAKASANNPPPEAEAPYPAYMGGAGPGPRTSAAVGGANLDAPANPSAGLPIDQRIRDAVALDPSLNYGSVLPLAHDPKTNTMSISLRGPLNAPVNGLLDLINGANAPQDGGTWDRGPDGNPRTLSPNATMALGQAVSGGLMPSPAGKMASAVGNRLFVQGMDTAPRPVLGNPLTGDFVQNPQLAQATPMMTHPLARGPTSPVPGVPESAKPLQFPSANAATPVAASAGDLSAAATPSELTAMTPREAFASKVKGERERLMEPVPSGFDNKVYIEGINPTAAEIMGNAKVSGDQKFNRQAPGNAVAHEAGEIANNTVYTDKAKDLAGDPVTTDYMQTARGEKATINLANSWGNMKPTNAEPVVKTIQGILTDPVDSERSVIQKYIQPILARMYDADGQLKSDPQRLYGIRRDVDDMLSSASASENPTLTHVAGQLRAIKSSLDGAIVEGAPGYQKFLDDFSADSKPIDEQKVLQEYLPGLFSGPKQMMTYSKVQRMMSQIVDRRAASGNDPAKSISDETMNQLWNLRDSLRRSTNIDLGKPRGSDSMSLARMAELGATGAAHVAGIMSPFPVVSNMAIQAVTSKLKANRLAAQTNRLINPENAIGPSVGDLQ